jgi:septum formation protein
MEIFDRFKQFDLILGSQSPRRKALLESAGFTFRTWVLPTSEDFPAELAPADVALHLCSQKADAFKGRLNKNSILITADTIVVKDKTILNKAAGEAEAFAMLSLLNGTSHNVITGVCISSENHRHCFTETTTVYFNHLSEEEINWYIRQFKPFDKAGAYGIQEWIGMTAVGRIEGCYYNVVGLPVASLYRELKSFSERYF